MTLPRCPSTLPTPSHLVHQWLTPRDAARRLGMSVHTLACYRSRGTGPRYSVRTVGKRHYVYYCTCALQAWLDDKAWARRVAHHKREAERELRRAESVRKATEGMARAEGRRLALAARRARKAAAKK
jgi:hypothetical protein